VSEIVGCTPRACEERLKKLRRLAVPAAPPPPAKSKEVVEEKKRGVKTGFAMARTREGVEIPLGVPLEVSRSPVVNGWFEEILEEEGDGGKLVWDERWE